LDFFNSSITPREGVCAGATAIREANVSFGAPHSQGLGSQSGWSPQFRLTDGQFCTLHFAICIREVSACEADGPGANLGFLTIFDVTNLAICCYPVILKT
jgi:hypothetical protein